MNRKLIAFAGIAGLTVLAATTIPSDNIVLAQSGSRSGGSYQSQGSGSRSGSGTQQRVIVQPAQKPFESRLWDWLSKVQYHNWASLPGRPNEAYAGESPHGAMLKLYANRTAVADPNQLPHGSILVKENYAADGTTLMAVTVMYRAKDFHAEGHDWYWAKYEPDGQVTRMEGRTVAGRVGMCIDCHAGAGGNDYSFANDR